VMPLGPTFSCGWNSTERVSTYVERMKHCIYTVRKL
jgi:hypothetical protein